MSGETTWRLTITPPEYTDQADVEAKVGEWARLSNTTPPAVETAPRSDGFGNWPTWAVTVPGDPDARPDWLESLNLYLWGNGYFCRLINTGSPAPVPSTGDESEG